MDNTTIANISDAKVITDPDAIRTIAGGEDFDRDFTRGHFDKGKLNTAIDDLKNVVDHNTLDPQDRDALTADLRDLRVMREEQRN